MSKKCKINFTEKNSFSSLYHISHKKYFYNKNETKKHWYHKFKLKRYKDLIYNKKISIKVVLQKFINKIIIPLKYKKTPSAPLVNKNINIKKSTKY